MSALLLIPHCALLNQIFNSLDDILSSSHLHMHEDSRDMQFFSALFSGARVSSYFTSALITVHLTPREKPTKTEAPEEETRKWGSLYGTRCSRMDELEQDRPNYTAALSTCNAPLPERFSSISRSLGATWRARASFLNRREEKREWCALCMSELANGKLLSFIIMQQSEHI